MKRNYIIFLVVLECIVSGCAFADSITMNGSVVNVAAQTITADYGGAVSKVLVSAGDQVRAGDSIALLETEKVYALQSGTVHLFGETGDSAEMVTQRYGAVAYIEPACQYTISASTKNAYDSEENKTIHPGETVYIRCVADSRHTGTGIVTVVSGTSFSVEVADGEFENSESVYLYRDAGYTASLRIGKGSISRQDPVAYTGEGIIVNYRTEDGAGVQKGSVLFETLAGSYSSHAEDLCQIKAGEDGVIAELNLNIGSMVSSGDAIATFYPNDSMRIAATVSETDLRYFNVGDTVKAEFTYLNDGDFSVQGTIEKISMVGSTQSEDSDEAYFTVWIIPESIEGLYYGMNAVICRVS